MGSSLMTKKSRKIKIIDVTPKGKSFDYLRPKGEIVVIKDEDFDTSCFEIRAEGRYSATVRLWPKLNNQMESQCFHDRTPRCSSLSTDSGFDEVD